MAHPIVRMPRRRTPVQPPGRGLRAASISTGHSACLPLRAHPLHLRSAPSPMRGLTARLPAQRAAKSAPRRIRRRLPAARGAARRLIRFCRRDALGGRRRSRLCAAASNLRLPVPTSSPSAPHTGGIPPWPRREWRRCRNRGETRRVLPPGALRTARPPPSGAEPAETHRRGGARPAARRVPGAGATRVWECECVGLWVRGFVILDCSNYFVACFVACFVNPVPPHCVGNSPRD